jgi:hypothetical protein
MAAAAVEAEKKRSIPWLEKRMAWFFSLNIISIAVVNC